MIIVVLLKLFGFPCAEKLRHMCLILQAIGDESMYDPWEIVEMA
jgi:hypothetical protein